MILAPAIEAFSVAANWIGHELAAFRPPEDLKPSAWAERHRVLPEEQSSRPGPWLNENAPYLRGIMDLCAAPGVVQMNIRKAAQVGVSEAIRNVIGYWADKSPDPAGIALPNREKGRKIVGMRIIPMFRSTPALKNLFTERSEDIQKSQLSLANGFLLHLMWSGSAAAMASDPMRRVVCDEVDMFLEWTGEQGSAINLTRKRLKTYEDRALQVNISTPTTKLGIISRLVEGSSMVLYFFVPCPKCGVFQRLVFPQVKSQKRFAKIKDPQERVENLQAAQAKTGRAVWYECSECKRRILESEKPAMVRQGRWGTEDGSITDAERIEEWPKGTRLAIQISDLYCLWSTWANAVAEIILAKGDLAALFDFKTQTLGEPFEEQIKSIEADIFETKSRRSKYPEGIVPAWAAKLIATIDTQHDHFYVVIRAWAWPMRSHRVWHGRIEGPGNDFSDLEEICFRRPWRVEGDAFGPVNCEVAVIDTGGTRMAEDPASRTAAVYRWAMKMPARVMPIKGMSRKDTRGLFIKPGKGYLDTGRGKKDGRQLTLWHLDTHHFSDQLADMIGAEISEGEDEAKKKVEQWTLSARNDPVYNAHLSSIRKIVVRSGGRVHHEWVPLSGARIDFYDCEVYQIAAAYLRSVQTLPPPEIIQQYREAQAKRAAPRGPAKPAGQGGGAGDAWIPRPL